MRLSLATVIPVTITPLQRQAFAVIQKKSVLIKALHALKENLVVRKKRAVAVRTKNAVQEKRKKELVAKNKKAVVARIKNAVQERRKKDPAVRIRRCAICRNVRI